MEVICPRCAGFDVHKQTVVACARIVGDGAPLQEVQPPRRAFWNWPTGSTLSASSTSRWKPSSCKCIACSTIARPEYTARTASSSLRLLGGQRSRSPVERSLVQHVDYVS